MKLCLFSNQASKDLDGDVDDLELLFIHILSLIL